MAGRIWQLQVVTVVVALTLTVLISVFSTVTLGYRDENLRVALGTAVTLIAALTAYLLYGRYRATRRTDAFVLFLALIALTAANIARIAGPQLADVDVDPISVWLPLSLQIFASVLLAAAAFAPSRQVEDAGKAWTGALLVALAAGATGIAAFLLGPHLAVGIDPQLSPARAGSPRVVGSPGLLACQLVVMVLAFAAALGFTVRARREDDELLGWLAIAATTSGFSRLNYFLFPSIYTGWVFTGDFLRVSAYVLILVGAMRQIALLQRRSRETAVLGERRRIARDLHDGLGQDLAFIAMSASSLAVEDSRLEKISQAAEQALFSSRAVIESIARDEEPFADSIARLAKRLCERAEVPLQLEVGDGLEAGYERREMLLRILGEGIGNAIHHGRPSLITVELSGAGPSLRLVIRDDGVGFDQAEPGNGFGLAGMQERVKEVGGEFNLRSRSGQGTEIQVVLE